MFSEADRLYWEFEEKFLRNYGSAIEHYNNNFEVHIVKNANHVFSFKKWQQQMLELTEVWLKEKKIIILKNTKGLNKNEAT